MNKDLSFRFEVTSNPEECEKLVTPAIVFVSTNHSSFEEVRTQGFIIGIRWCHYSIIFGIIRI